MDYATDKNVPVMLIVHHSADNNPRDQFDNINEWHRQRGFPLSKLGFYIGYQYVINFDGEMRQAREDNEGGAHCIGHNFDSIGICLEGNFNQGQPSAAQVAALQALMLSLATKYGIGVSDVYPHRHFKTTSCYGSNLSDDWCREVFLEVRINDLDHEDATTP